MIKMIVVDKNLIARKGIKEFFRDPTIEVIGEASSGTSAINLIAKHQPDIVTLNPNIADITSSKLSQIISRSSPKTKIIFLAGTRHLPTLYRLLRDTSAKGLLTMDSNFSGAEAIQQVYKGGTYIQPDLSYDLIQYVKERNENLETKLSTREYEVLTLSAQGKNTLEIADNCSISEKTVYNVKSRAMKKLGLKIGDTEKLKEIILVKEGAELTPAS